MNIDTNNPVILSITISIISFIVIILYFLCFKPFCIQKIDVKGNIYIDRYLMILYATLLSLSIAIGIMIIKINFSRSIEKNVIRKQEIIPLKPVVQMKDSLSY